MSTRKMTIKDSDENKVRLRTGNVKAGFKDYL